MTRAAHMTAKRNDARSAYDSEAKWRAQRIWQRSEM